MWNRVGDIVIIESDDDPRCEGVEHPRSGHITQVLHEAFLEQSIKERGNDEKRGPLTPESNA